MFRKAMLFIIKYHLDVKTVMTISAISHKNFIIIWNIQNASDKNSRQIEHNRAFYSAKIPSIEKARSIFKIGRFIFFVIEYRIMSMRTAKKKKIKI